MKSNFLIGKLSFPNPYTIQHDALYGSFLLTEERDNALKSSEIYRASGLMSLISPKRNGLIDPVEFVSCIEEEFLRKPIMKEKIATSRVPEELLWEHFNPLWEYYFGDYVPLIKRKQHFIYSSFPIHLKEIAVGSSLS